MSQKFDEGGAKGLLLVNLGVASDGCRIILDSKEDTTDSDENERNADDKENDNDEDEVMEEEKESDDNTECVVDEGEIDISDIRNKLQELLLCSPLESIQLVPQLEELRDSYNALEEEGFTDKSKVQKLTVSDTSYFRTFAYHFHCLPYTYGFNSLSVMPTMRTKKRLPKKVFIVKQLRGAVLLESCSIPLVFLHVQLLQM